MAREPSFDHEKYAERIYGQGSVEALDKQAFGGQWLWIFGTTDLGKFVVLGPFATEMEALERGDVLNDIRVFELDTRSQPKATKEIRAILLKEGMSSDEALQRQLHEKGLARELARTR